MRVVWIGFIGSVVPWSEAVFGAVSVEGSIPGKCDEISYMSYASTFH